MMEQDEAGARHSVHEMDHFTVRTPDLDVTRAFYEMLGFSVGPRPADLPMTGIWLYAGSRPVLHVIGPEPLPESPRGMLDHMAFGASGLRAFAALLDAQGVAYELRRLEKPFNVWQVFFDDPFGARVEFDFNGDEAPPER